MLNAGIEIKETELVGVADTNHECGSAVAAEFGGECFTDHSELFDKVDAFSVGQFIYLFEVTTSIAGALLKINTYDQPAVELGKDATFALMGKDGKYTDELTYPQWAGEIEKDMAVKDEYLV